MIILSEKKCNKNRFKRNFVKIFVISSFATFCTSIAPPGVEKNKKVEKFSSPKNQTLQTKVSIVDGVIKSGLLL